MTKLDEYLKDYVEEEIPSLNLDGYVKVGNPFIFSTLTDGGEIGEELIYEGKNDDPPIYVILGKDKDKNWKNAWKYTLQKYDKA